MSTAGGLYTAFQRGHDAGCDSMLVFTKSNRQWAAKPLTEEDIAAWKNAAQQFSHITPVAIHASYLINIGSSDPALWAKSYDSLKIEVERAEALGIPYVSFHPGAYMEWDEASGLANIGRALKRLVEETAGFQTTICLETMAGQGTHLGHRFEHLATILEQAEVDSGRTPRLGVCLDTCHIFVAGYDFRTPETYAATMAEFDRLVGLDRIYCFHFNDSKHKLGERKDRHEHIGRGEIGLAGFANFVNDPRWANHPAHLETNKTETAEDGSELDMDIENLKTLRSLVR